MLYENVGYFSVRKASDRKILSVVNVVLDWRIIVLEVDISVEKAELEIDSFVNNRLDLFLPCAPFLAVTNLQADLNIFEDW